VAPPPFGHATPISPESLPRETMVRLRRVRNVAWVLDRSIPFGKWRIGLDPLLGLFPGIGDWLGAGLALYLLYEGARLGLPLRVLTRMSGNIIVEAVVGTVPVAGDLFDFIWKASTRNVRIIERTYQPTMRPRSFRRIWLGLFLFGALLLLMIGVLVYFVLQVLDALLKSVF
jgi:hypothetical protein